jgi:hypothetical protein
MVTGSVRIIFFIVAHGAQNLFAQIVQRNRVRSAVPQKGYGVPAHRDDDH